MNTETNLFGKLYIEVKTLLRSTGTKYYSVHSDFGTSGSGCGLNSAEDVVKHVRGLLSNPSNAEGDIVKLSPERVILTNTTSIKINIPAMLAQLSGNSLLAFLDANVQQGCALQDEIVSKEAIEDHKRMQEEDKFDKDVLDPMREKIHELEDEARKFGLPEHAGWSIWDKREKQAARKKYPQAKNVFDALDKINADFDKAYCTYFKLEIPEEDEYAL